MKIGGPTEIKTHENRVALTPAGAEALTSAGHQVLVQKGAGIGSGQDDEAYRSAGARIVPDAKAVFAEADMIVKVKEPLAQEWPLIRPGQTLFTYFHLAASRPLTEAMLKCGAHCLAYETLEVGRTLPLLTPMSEVAGRMSIQAGAKYLEAHHGGVGVLLGGVAGVLPAHVLVLGGGVVGAPAALMAAGLGADVTLMDVNLDRLRYLEEILPKNCNTVFSTPLAVRQALPGADLVIGAVLIPGGAAPKLVRREDLKTMKRGSVIVDVAVDQGGCVETCRPTTHDDPVFVEEGVVHYCVANMPGAVPRTSTFALTNATLPYVLQLANQGVAEAIRSTDTMRTAANIVGGKLTSRAVAESFKIPFVPAREVIASL